MTGRRQTIREHFSDIPELMSEDDGSRNVFGMLGGEGTQSHYTTHERASAQGVSYLLHCDRCGTRNEVQIFWQEMIIVGHSHLPPGWQYREGRLYPDVGCANPSCRNVTSVQITPDEAARHVKAAVAARYITPQQVAQVGQSLKGR